MSDQSDEKKSTSALIVESAFHLFINNGYHGTSMRQLAQEAGIAVSGIYNHFPAKEDIFVAVLEAYHPLRQILPAVDEFKASDVDIFFRQLGEQALQVLNARPEFLNLILIEVVEFKSAHVPILFDIFFPEILKFIQHLSELHSQMRAISPAMVIRAFIGMVFSFYLTEALLGAYFPPEMVVDAFDHNVDIFLHGIMPPPDEAA